MEALVFSLFLGGIAASVFFGFDTLWALGFGVLCFMGYALWEGKRLSEVLWAMGGSLRSLWKLLCMFFLIGAVTALWRQCGTVAWIVTTAVRIIEPRFFVLYAFLLSVFMTMLVGSSLCTSCTMGLILVLMARSAGVREELVAGAVLSGALVGDRCSPMSSCAHLLCSVTRCDFYTYIRRSLASGVLPFLMTAVVYGFWGVEEDLGAAAALGESIGCGFRLHWVLALPAAVIVLLCLFRVNIYLTMAGSFLTALALGLWLQRCSAAEILTAAVWGFVPGAGQSELLRGGGALSMLRVAGIIGLSSTYLGIFRLTRLKAWLERPFDRLAARLGNRPAAVLLSLPVAMFGCSQSMSTLLMGELCSHGAENEEEAALQLADSVVVTAALIPWNTLNAALCGAMGVSSGSVLFAVYVFVLPLVNTLWNIRKKTPVSP